VAYSGKKHGIIGKHKPITQEMTIADVLSMVPAYLWPPAGGNGCFRNGCSQRDIAKEDRPQRGRRLIREQKMVDGEWGMISGIANMLNLHVYSSERSGFFDVYAPAGAGRQGKWMNYVRTFSTGPSARIV
jgi:hypothetical protein